MKTSRFFVAPTCVLLFGGLLAGNLLGKDKKKPKNDVCSSGTTGSLTTALPICGSATTACEVDIRRSGEDSSVATPNIPNAKANGPFRVKVGTTITFKSTSKDTGFVLDFGESAPFDSGSVVIGGADRPVSVVVKKPGCYTYSIGACTAGTRYGMCGEDAAQFVVSTQ